MQKFVYLLFSDLLEMLLSTINISRCGRWQKIRLIFNAIGCSNFCTIPTGTRHSCSNMLVLKGCGCIHPITSSHLQLGHFNQTAAISSTTKTLTKAAADENEQQSKASKSTDEPNEKQNQQQTKSTPERTDAVKLRPKDLTSKKCISIGIGRTLYIQCQQWESGQKFLNIYKFKSSWRIPRFLPNILVPQDAYKFVAAMDRLVRQLPVDEPTHPPEGEESPLYFTQIVEGTRHPHYNGRHYDFKLSARHRMGGEWQFHIQSVPTSEEHNDKEKSLYFTFWALPWLRQQMIEMLEEHDGSEKIGEMPTIPKWATRVEEDAENKEGRNEQSESGMQTEMDQPTVIKLAKSFLPLGRNRELEIECCQGSSGQKTVEIAIMNPQSTTTPYLPKISMPQDAYKFLRAMDRMIGQLPAEAPANPAADASPPILANQMVEGGLFYDFQLLVLWFERGRHWVLNIRSVKTVQEHKPKEMYFPLWTLPWLREQMASMLVEHDGTERIDEIPTMSEWATKEAKVLELAESRLPLGPNHQLYIQCEQGRSGHKTIKIYILSEQKLKFPRVIQIGVPKIHVPQVAYKFMGAMDRLIGQLPVEAPANPPPTADESPPVLANQMVEGGLFYDFQLSILWFERGRHWVLNIRSVKTVQEHNEKGVQIPLWTLPLLRQKMATFLEKLDGTQRIDKMPTMPEWATLPPNIRLQSRYSN